MRLPFDFLTQAYPPNPKFTEKDVPDLKGKVYIVTGANVGIGKELAQILYSKNATVYVAARSKEKAEAAIQDIKNNAPTSSSTGSLIFLHLDLADLSTIKASAQEFLSRETKLHVLFNNAGVMNPPQGSKTAQGHELQLGVNNLGTFLFTKLLTPILVSTAKTSAPGSVRIVWVASSAAEAPFTPSTGVVMSNLDYHEERSGMHKYGVSKAGNYFQGTEAAARLRSEGVVNVPLNPGNLNSSLWRNHGALVNWFLRTFVLHPVIYGAYTELFAGLSPEVTLEKTGEWVAPWGRHLKIKDSLVQGSKSKSEGGTGLAKEFWEWNEEQVKPYL